jgi:hypothetical protein
VMGVPMGTVMSTLSRARDRFRHAAGDLLKNHPGPESDSPDDFRNRFIFMAG